jgi:hypothetical protein
MKEKNFSFEGKHFCFKKQMKNRFAINDIENIKSKHKLDFFRTVNNSKTKSLCF